MYHSPLSSSVVCSLYSIEFILIDVICFVQVFSKIGNRCYKCFSLFVDTKSLFQNTWPTFLKSFNNVGPFNLFNFDDHALLSLVFFGPN